MSDLQEGLHDAITGPAVKDVHRLTQLCHEVAIADAVYKQDARAMCAKCTIRPAKVRHWTSTQTGLAHNAATRCCTMHQHRHYHFLTPLAAGCAECWLLCRSGYGIMMQGTSGRPTALLCERNRSRSCWWCAALVSSQML